MILRVRGPPGSHSPVDVHAVVLLHPVLRLPGDVQTTGHEFIVLLNFLEKSQYLKWKSLLRSAG